MMDTPTIARLFTATLHPHGFRRKGNSWYREGAGVLAVVNLQKSCYSNLYYLNVAFWIHELEHGTFPKEYQCHVRIRAESLPGADREAVLTVFDMDEAMPIDERTERLCFLLESHVTPFVEKLSSVDGLMEAVNQGIFEQGLVDRQAMALFADRQNQ